MPRHTNLADIPDSALDEACHDAASAMASNANNEGTSGQIEFLRIVCGFTDNEILEAASSTD